MLIQFAARLERRPPNLKLKHLSLTTMRCLLGQTISEAAATNLSLVQTLEPLADVELEARDARSIARRFRSIAGRDGPKHGGVKPEVTRGGPPVPNRLLHYLAHIVLSAALP